MVEPGARRTRAHARVWIARLLLACSLGIALPACPLLAEEPLPLSACAHGKPHYCYKYGQGLCRKTNNMPNAELACEDWTAACVDCQTAIAYCFDRSPEPVFEGSAECTACKAEMDACMAAIDKQFWPNR